MCPLLLGSLLFGLVGAALSFVSLTLALVLLVWEQVLSLAGSDLELAQVLTLVSLVLA